jgi:hypothetical protein
VTSAPAGWLQALERNVRANSAYQLVPLGSIADQYRQSLEAAGVDPARAFGLLVGDPGRGLANKVVDTASAELFTALGRAGRLPPQLAARFAELVFDGVLEVETAAGYVSGPLAYEAVVGSADRHEPDDHLGRLSQAALAYAERLRLTDVDRITARLYYYNRVPVAPRWNRAYPGPGAVHDLLRCSTLSRHWTSGQFDDSKPVPWLSWTRRGDPLRTRPDQLVYKLYVSPAVDAIPDVLPVLVDALTTAGARRFKVGADAPGLLRPDKIIVYMATAEELLRVMRVLERAFDGVRPHGVPFTSELAGDGLLSWGGDPTPDSGPIGQGTESWRLSVTRRLAEALAAAQRAPLRRVRASDFALARLTIDGVDIRSFAPTGLKPPAPLSPIG